MPITLTVHQCFDSLYYTRGDSPRGKFYETMVVRWEDDTSEGYVGVCQYGPGEPAHFGGNKAIHPMGVHSTAVAAQAEVEKIRASKIAKGYEVHGSYAGKVVPAKVQAEVLGAIAKAQAAGSVVAAAPAKPGNARSSASIEESATQILNGADTATGLDLLAHMGTDINVMKAEVARAEAAIQLAQTTMAARLAV